MNIILFDSLANDNEIPMSDPRARHIQKVLHLQIGDSFICGAINQHKGLATITKMDSDSIGFTYTIESKGSAELYPVTLLVAQVRPICMRRVLREAVSLGVERIILCTTETGEKSYAKANLYTSGEYKDILLDGAMQSGECGVSEVLFASSVKEAMMMIGSDMVKIVLDNVWDGKPLSAMSLVSDQPVVLAIGGERGFTEREREIFKQNKFQFASLGKRILRTETACSAGLAVLLGRMNLL